jgi:hypothetical protein
MRIGLAAFDMFRLTPVGLAVRSHGRLPGARA